ncbi:MAG: flagellar filament capping protein FliD [Nitrospirae bacterium]|nr:flagellar filament capping protein FliD [Nitrospirota bacterium]
MVPYQFHPIAVTADELKHLSQNITRARFTGARLSQNIRFAYSIIDGRPAVAGATTEATFTPQAASEGFETSPAEAVSTQTVHFIDLRGMSDIATTSFLFVRRRVPAVILNSGITSALRVQDVLQELSRVQNTNPIQDNLETDPRVLDLRAESFKALKSLLEGLRSQVVPLLDAASFIVKSGTTSDSSIVNASATNEADTESFNVAVQQVTRAHVVESDTFSSPDARLTSLGGGDLVGSFRINGFKILVDTRGLMEDRDTVGGPGAPYGVSPTDFTQGERRAVGARMWSLQGIADQINFGLEDLNKNGIIDGPITVDASSGKAVAYIRVSEDRIVDPNEFRTDYVADADKLESAANRDGIVTTNSDRIGVRASIVSGRLRLESLDPGRRIALENTSGSGEANIIDQLGLTYRDTYQAVQADEPGITYNSFTFKNPLQDEQPSIVVSPLTRRSEYETSIGEFTTGLDLLLDGTSRFVKNPLDGRIYSRGENSLTQKSRLITGESIDDVVRNLILAGVILPTDKNKLIYDTETVGVDIAAEALLERMRTFVDTYNATMLEVNDLLAGRRVLERDATMQAIRTDLVRGVEFPVGVLSEDRDELSEIGITNASPEKFTFVETALFTLLRRLRAGDPQGGPPVPKGERSIFQRLSQVGISALTNDMLELDEGAFLSAAERQPKMVQDLFIPEDGGGVAERLYELLTRMIRSETGSIDLHLSLIKNEETQLSEVQRQLREETARILALRTKGDLATDILV